MAEIPAKCYKLKVPEKPKMREWWDDVNLDSEVADHGMPVYLFEVASSPRCINYALRKAAVDISNCYGNVAAPAIMKNFYADELFKSVKDAQDLIRRIQKICSAGIQLKEVYQQQLISTGGHFRILQEGEGVNDAHLINEELPTERALEVCWNLEQISFC